MILVVQHLKVRRPRGHFGSGLSGNFRACAYGSDFLCHVCALVAVVPQPVPSNTFNGREFKSVGEMPAVVRRLFERAMSHADASQNGIPDRLEGAISGSANKSFSTATVESKLAATANITQSNSLSERAPIISTLDRTANTREIFLRILLGIVAIATLAGAVFLMVKMDSGSRSQGGRFYVAIAALVILAAVDSQFRKLISRRQPFSLTTTEAERRYDLVSLLPAVFSAVLLIGLAWLLP